MGNRSNFHRILNYFYIKRGGIDPLGIDTSPFQKTSKPACNYFFPSTRSKGFNIHSKTDSASFT